MENSLESHSFNSTPTLADIKGIYCILIAFSFIVIKVHVCEAISRWSDVFVRTYVRVYVNTITQKQKHIFENGFHQSITKGLARNPIEIQTCRSKVTVIINNGFEFFTHDLSM